METTTIAITKDLKEQIDSFGSRSETYSQIISRLLESAKERQLQDLLMDERGTVPIEKALAEAKKRWPE